MRQTVEGCGVTVAAAGDGSVVKCSRLRPEGWYWLPATAAMGGEKTNSLDY